MKKWDAQKRAYPLSHSTRFHISDWFKKGGPAVELRSPSRAIVRLEMLHRAEAPLNIGGIRFRGVAFRNSSTGGEVCSSSCS
jgi:hypothetical protein